MKDFGSTLGKWKMYISAYESVNCSIFSDSMIPWTVAHQAPLSMEFSRQEYWCGLPFPSPGDLPDSGIELRSPALQVDSLSSEPPGGPPSTEGLLNPLLICTC